MWSKSEEVWEGTFDLIASFIILAMGIAFLRLEQAKAKWTIKLAHAFEAQTKGERSGRASRYALFLLPFITVLREGLEAVVFAGGVRDLVFSGLSNSTNTSTLRCPLEQTPSRSRLLWLSVSLLVSSSVSRSTRSPTETIAKLDFVALLIYGSGSRLTLHFFLIVSTSILLLIGAGLFSSSCADYQLYVFNRGVGADVAELGDGPGSFNVNGNVWHLVSIAFHPYLLRTVRSSGVYRLTGTPRVARTGVEAGVYSRPCTFISHLYLHPSNLRSHCPCSPVVSDGLTPPPSARSSATASTGSSSLAPSST